MIRPLEIPPPLEWHPAYREYTNLLDWLNRLPSHLDHDNVLKVATPRKPLWSVLREGNYDPDERLPIIVRTLHKIRCWGPAPYVGRPFIYVWHVATDELGRSIASDSYIFYTDQLDRKH